MSSYTRLQGVPEELLRGKDGVWVFMTKPSPCLLAYAFFEPNLEASRAEKSSGFEDVKILMNNQYIMFGLSPPPWKNPKNRKMTDNLF